MPGGKNRGEGAGMSDFSVGFDTPSLEAIARLYGFKVLLDEEIEPAIKDVAQTITEEAQAKTWQVFDNPTGELADSIYPFVVSPTEMEIRVGVPYGRRRERGFSGMTDSLGRFFANDPAKPYLAPALEVSRDYAEERIGNAVRVAMNRLGGG